MNSNLFWNVSPERPSLVGSHNGHTQKLGRIFKKKISWYVEYGRPFLKNERNHNILYYQNRKFTCKYKKDISIHGS